MPIFDQGYQHWKGPLAGHAWRWLAVARHGVRATLKGRIVKGLLFLAWVPAMVLVPAAVAYVLGVAFSLDAGVIRDTHRLLWGGILYGLAITVSAGTFMLALSSLSRRSIYVGLTWAGFCFLTLLVSSILIGI